MNTNSHSSSGSHPIAVRNFRFQGRDGSDLELARHAITAFIGGSGSGKTRILLGLFGALAERQLHFLEGTTRQPAHSAELGQVLNLPFIQIPLLDTPAPTTTVAALGNLQQSARSWLRDSPRRLCAVCHGSLARGSLSSFAGSVMSRLQGQSVRVLAVCSPNGRADWPALVRRALGKGFTVGCSHGTEFDLSSAAGQRDIEALSGIVVDRLVADEDNLTRLERALEVAWELEGDGVGIAPEADLVVVPSLISSPTGICTACLRVATDYPDAAFIWESSGDELISIDRSAEHQQLLTEQLGGVSIGDLLHTPIASLIGALSAWNDDPILESTLAYIGTLVSLGLGRVSLGRGFGSLSTGERLRVQLAGVPLNGLTGTALVLDDLARGLHPVDLKLVHSFLRNRVDVGDTVLCGLPFDPRWESGGSQLYLDPAGADSEPCHDAPPFVMSRVPATVRLAPSIEVPAAHITVVTGRSGTGKSTLLATCHAALEQERKAAPKSTDAASLRRAVHYNFESVTFRHDQLVLHLSGVLPELAELWARLQDAREQGAAPRHFLISRRLKEKNLTPCPECAGLGFVLIADNRHAPCTTCRGTLLHPVLASVRFRGLTFAESLQLTVREAAEQFGGIHRIREPLKAMTQLGLGSLPLARPATLLSRGEGERLRLHQLLLSLPKAAAVVLLDDPAAQWNAEQCRSAIARFKDLTSRGHTIIASSHNPYLIAAGDFVVELCRGNDTEPRVDYRGTPVGYVVSHDSEEAAEVRRILANHAL